MYIYILTPIQSIFSHVRIFQERENIDRLQLSGKEFFYHSNKKRRSSAFAFLFFLIDKMYKHSKHAHICATNNPKLLNHECTHITIASTSHQKPKSIRSYRMQSNNSHYMFRKRLFICIFKTNHLMTDQYKSILLSYNRILK